MIAIETNFGKIEIQEIHKTDMFAIHKANGTDEFRITHLPTGMICFPSPLDNYITAHIVLQHLEASREWLDWNWTELTDERKKALRSFIYGLRSRVRKGLLFA